MTKPQSSPQSPNPTHVANMSTPANNGIPTYVFAILVFSTLVAMLAGGVYMSGKGDDVVKYVMEKYFKAEATAEEKALEQAGETKAEGFL